MNSEQAGKFFVQERALSPRFTFVRLEAQGRKKLGASPRMSSALSRFSMFLLNSAQFSVVSEARVGDARWDVFGALLLHYHSLCSLRISIPDLLLSPPTVSPDKNCWALDNEI